MRIRSEPRFRRGLTNRRPLPPPPHHRRGASITPQRLREVSARPAFHRRRRGLGGLLTLGILLGIVLVVALSSMTLRRAYAGKIYPRVSVNGYSLDGRTPRQGRAYLHAIEGAEIHAPFTLRTIGHVWTVTPGDFGAHYNVDAAVRAAYAVGRRGSWWEQLLEQARTIVQGVSVPMQGAHDNALLAAYLNALAPAVFVAPRPATVGASGDHIAILREPLPGQRLDPGRALAAVSADLDTHQLTPIDLPTVTVNSAISHDVALAAVASTRGMLASPVTLTYPNAPNPWVLNPDSLARLLTFTPAYNHGAWTLQVGIDLAKLDHALRTVASTIYKPPHDATYEVAGNYVTVLPDLNGYALDVRATADSLLALQNAVTPARVINVPTRPVVAHFTAAQAQELAFNALMSQTETSWTSLAQAAEPVTARDTAHDVAIAAGLIDNVRVAPGAVLTYTAAVGPITAVRDYYPGLNALGATDISGINGAVVRVATALYQAAYTAGLGIERRVAPPYATDGNAQLGLDAVAYGIPGGPDLVIKNTTAHPILIKTAVDSVGATVKVYLYNNAAAVPNVSVGKPTLVTHPDGRVDVSYSRQVVSSQPVDGDRPVTHYLPLEAP